MGMCEGVDFIAFVRSGVCVWDSLDGWCTCRSVWCWGLIMWVGMELCRCGIFN